MRANRTSSTPTLAGEGAGRTLVSFHAHPDDEALLTGGTLAKAAAAGCRVVLVVATAGEAGLAAGYLVPDLGARRIRELHTSAAALGCARVVLLGYRDSGYHGSEGAAGFATCDVEAAAARLAAILIEEHASILTVYDARGGYGHPDHIQVHRVGMRAAAIAGTPVVWAATIDRDLLVRGLGVVRRLRRLVPGLAIPDLTQAYTPRRDITHRVDVSRFASQKRAALAAHHSQTTADTGARTIAALLRLPRPVFRILCRYEWFIEYRLGPATASLASFVLDGVETGSGR